MAYTGRPENDAVLPQIHLVGLHSETYSLGKPHKICNHREIAMTNLRPVSFLVLAWLLSACSEAPQDQAAQPSADSSAQSKCSLVMGWDPWEPYQYVNVNGQVTGLDVELVRAIAANAGCRVTFHQDNWSTLLTNILDGDVDMLAGASLTASREEFAWFTEPYREESFVLYVRAADRDKYPEEDLKTLLENGKKIGVTMDYVYGDEVSSLQDDPTFAEQFVGVPISELNYSKLADFEIDGFLEDPFVASAILRRKGLGEQIAAHDIEIHTGQVHLMLSKTSINEAMLNRLNNSLVELKENGKLDEVMQKYRN